MPHPDEPYYCSEQIPIPPELPDILKQFTKAAIRTQPKDLLNWSAKYFRCMANGEIPPVKDRLELNVATQKTDSGLTTGILKTLHKQISVKKPTNLKFIEEKWNALSLPKDQFDLIVQLGNFEADADWMKFMPIACTTISKDITDSMSKVCEILTSDPPGSNSRIKFDVFKEIYTYLITQVEKSTPMNYVEEVCSFLETEWVKRQDGLIHPKNFTHTDCPKLSQLV